jgi:hypothetical protein
MQNLGQLFLLDPILCRFRIIRCNRQAALHPAMFNYTPLVIRGADKNKQLANIKSTQTGINRNKWTFWIIKSLEPLKYSKNQLRPLVRPGSVNFGQNFWNLSHETVPLMLPSCQIRSAWAWYPWVGLGKDVKHYKFLNLFILILNFWKELKVLSR